MTEAEIRGFLTAQRFIEDSLFGADRVKTEIPPDFDMIVEDVFVGLVGTWTLHFDADEQACQPDNDWRTTTRAKLRYVELDGDEYKHPVRFNCDPDAGRVQVSRDELATLQDLADDEIQEIFE